MPKSSKFYLILLIITLTCRNSESDYIKCYIHIAKEERIIYDKVNIIEKIPFGTKLYGIAEEYHVPFVAYKKKIHILKDNDIVLGIDDCSVLDLENSFRIIRKSKVKKFPSGTVPKIDYLAIFPEKFNEKFQSLTLIRNGKRIVIKRYEDRNME